MEATLTPAGLLHLWAPGASSSDVAERVRTAAGRRWPRLGDLAEREAEQNLEGERRPGLTLQPLEAAAALSALRSSEPAPEDLTESLRFWALANGFLLSLLSRGRFFPRLVRRRDGEAEVAMWLVDLASERRGLDGLRLACPRRAVDVPEPDRAIPEYLVEVGDAVVRDAARRLRWAPFDDAPDPTREAITRRVLDGLFPGVQGARGTAFGADGDRPRSALAGGLPDPGTALVGAAKLVFTLDPPEHGDVRDEPAEWDPWRIRFHLDSSGTALLPVSEVWEARDPADNLRRFGLANPALPLLETLGRAARAWPVLERGLAGEAPEAVEISMAEAYDFLREGREVLGNLGYGIRIPTSLATQRGRRPILRLHVTPAENERRPRRRKGPSTPAGSGLGLDALVRYRWEVAIGDATWSLSEFRKLTRGKRSLVRGKRGWVRVDGEVVDRLLREASRRRVHAERQPVLRHALRERLGLERTSPDLFAADDDLVLAEVRGDAWIGSLFRALEAASDELGPLDPPKGLHTELRPYQRVGYGWLRLLADHGLGGCLADDMGLGKTCQALTFLLGEQERGRLNRPWLLVCPNSIVANWRKEAERFAPSLRFHVRQGSKRSRGFAFERAVAENDVIVCSFGIAQRDSALLEPVIWGGIIIDEAQNLKNPGAKQTRAIRRLSAPIRFALTGTPLENRLTDLWSIMEILNPGFLGPLRTFRRKYSAAVEGARDEDATAQLRRLVRPFILRRLKTDPKVIRDLPEKHQTRVYCTLTPEQAALYQAAVDDCLDRIEENTGFVRRGEILRTLTRLRQICNHPENVLGGSGPLAGRSGKLTRLVEILEEVQQRGESALVFTQFARMARLLSRHLTEVLDVEIPVLHGAVPVRERDAIVARFQADTHPPPALVLSLRTGGYGLNLTRATHVVHYDRWWNPAVENQATDRAFRIGQTRRVLVHKFICTGTLEERIADLLERKTALAESVIGTGEGWLTSLTSDALQNVLALDAEAAPA